MLNAFLGEVWSGGSASSVAAGATREESVDVNYVFEESPLCLVLRLELLESLLALFSSGAKLD